MAVRADNYTTPHFSFNTFNVPASMESFSYSPVFTFYVMEVKTRCFCFRTISTFQFALFLYIPVSISCYDSSMTSFNYLFVLFRICCVSSFAAGLHALSTPRL